MTAPRNRRREELSRAVPALTEPSRPWVATACAALLLAALTSGWWALVAVLVGLVAVVMLGVLASERSASTRPLEATAAPSESLVIDRRTGLPVDEEGPWN